jgi:hypothetical protein
MIVDISSRFKNDYPKSCPMSYLVSEINSNGSAVNMSLKSGFITLSSDGIFSVKN